MLPNFKALGPTEAELHILKVEKLDACIRPLFANSVTYVCVHACVCPPLRLPFTSGMIWCDIDLI